MVSEDTGLLGLWNKVVYEACRNEYTLKRCCVAQNVGTVNPENGNFSRNHGRRRKGTQTKGQVVSQKGLHRVQNTLPDTKAQMMLGQRWLGPHISQDCLAVLRCAYP